MSIPQRLKIARKLIGYSQKDAAIRAGLEQKDISLLETGGKKFIPNEYIQFLYNEGIDINSIYNDSENVSLKKRLPAELPYTFNEPANEYQRAAPVLKGANRKKNVSP